MKKQILLFVLGLSAFMHAQVPGTLDATFNAGGIYSVNIGSSVSDDYGHAIAIQSDGKIVLTGIAEISGQYQFSTIRCNSDGTPDLSFSADGKDNLNLSQGMDYAYCVAIQTDNKIVIGGSAGGDLAVVRYNANGTLDNTFGLNGVAIAALSSSNDQANAVVVQADGKIVLGGYAMNGSSSDFILMRYNANGQPDNTFGTNGVVSIPINGTSEGIRALALQSDGRIVAGGFFSQSGLSVYAVGRFNSDGSPDVSFGTNGWAFSSPASGNCFVNALALQSDGKIVAVGSASTSANNDWGIVRFNTNGTPDNTFGNNGIQVTGIGTQDHAYAVVIQSNGKLLVAGASNNGSTFDFAVAKYMPSGTLDNTFGVAGVRTHSVGAGHDQILSAALQPDGKLVVGGSAFSAQDFHEFVIARYNAECIPAQAPSAISGPVSGCAGSKIYSVSPVAGASSYSWTLPNGWTGTSTTNSISVNATGSGTIRVAAANACGSSSLTALVVTLSTCTGTDEFSAHRFSVFPNPACGHITITSSAETLSTFSIISLTGEEVMKGEFYGSTQLNTTGLSKGFYLVTVSTKHGAEKNVTRLTIH